MFGMATIAQKSIDWTRPRVSRNTIYSITCRSVFRGDGTTAKDGSEKVREVVTNTSVLNVVVEGVHLGLLVAESVHVGDIAATAVYLGDEEIRRF